MSDWSYSFDRGQTITITIGQVRNYSIELVAQAGAYTETYAAVTGKGAVKEYAIGPSKITLHMLYFDDAGNAKDVKYLLCPGLMLRLSFTSHGKCEDYNEATVLMQPGN